MNARVLRAENGATVEARLADYVQRDDVARAATALDAVALVIDEAPAAAADVAGAIRRGGNFAELLGARLVVVATLPSLEAAQNELVGAARVVASELVRAATADRRPPTLLRLRERTLDLGARPRIMGILNVTPDSFYDRGRYAGVDRARERAAELAALGADIIDIGGQSYSSANARVDESEERRRVVPVVKALVRDRLDVVLSIDTFKSSVAEAALAAGAHLINDCSGLQEADLAGVVARYDAALVIMHIKGELNIRQADYRYDDALAEILDFLGVRLARARAAGVAAESLIADPGLEFGKEPSTDLEILARFGDLRSLGVPTLLAASRKNFLSRLFERPSSALLVPSLAAAAAGVMAGAGLVRVHDVAETVALVTLLAALRGTNRAPHALAQGDAASAVGA